MIKTQSCKTVPRSLPKVKLSKGDTEPIFNIEGINFAYLKKSSLYVVATTRFNISPAYIL